MNILMRHNKLPMHNKKVKTNLTIVHLFLVFFSIASDLCKNRTIVFMKLNTVIAIAYPSKIKENTSRS